MRRKLGDAHEAVERADDREAERAVSNTRQAMAQRRVEQVRSQLQTQLDCVEARLRGVGPVDQDDWNIIANLLETARNMARRIGFDTTLAKGDVNGR